MWERLTAPEDSFSKLQRENLAIIESYGTSLMEVVCRDACDGHEIGRVRADKSTSSYGVIEKLDIESRVSSFPDAGSGRVGPGVLYRQTVPVAGVSV